MSMFDKLVATDLAALGTDVMQHRMSVDASLAVVEARRLRPARTVVVTSDPSRWRAVRIARWVALMTLVASGGVVAALYRMDVIYTSMRLYFADSGKAFAVDWDYSAYNRTPVVPLVVGAIVAVGYLLAYRISLRVLDRRQAPAVDVLASRVVARRLASLATNIVGILGGVIVCVIVTNPFGIRRDYSCPDDCWNPQYTERLFIVLLIVSASIMVRALATEVSPRIEHNLRRIDGWVVAARIGSITALVTVMGVLWSIQGDWDEFFNGQTLFAVLPGRKHMLEVIAWDVTLAAAAIGMLAILIGFACARETWLRRRSRLLLALEHRTAVMAGVILGVGSWAAEIRFDHDSYGYPDALGLRLILTATGGIAVLLVVAALTLRRRRRELALLGSDVRDAHSARTRAPGST